METPYYEIRVAGRLEERWLRQFDGLTLLRQDNNETIIRGAIADQAALHGLLNRIRDLGLELLAVQRMKAYQ